MNILMIGGTGTISYDATKYFLSKGHQIFLLNRGHRNDLKYDNLSYIIGNANNYDNLSTVLEDRVFDVILDFIIYNRAQMEKRMSIYKGKCKQFIFISSATVYEPTESIINEKSPVGNDSWSYSRAKLECERYLENNAARLGINYTIIRPYITYDVRRLPFPVITKGNYYSLIDRIGKGKPIIVCGNGDNKITLTHTKDFAIALEGLLLNPIAQNQVFHITGDCITTWNEILDIICKRLNKKAEVVYIPAMELATYFPSERDELLYDKSCNHLFDNSKICRAVPEFKTTYLVEEGISLAVDNLVQTDSLHRIDDVWNDTIDVIIEQYEKKRGHVIHKSSVRSRMQYHFHQDKVFWLVRKGLRVLKNL